MEEIRKEFEMNLSKEKAFQNFIYRLNEWWPKEFTWSGKALQEIYIEQQENGHCIEIGPHDFRCDWGRVLTWNPPDKITFTWQIGPNREPQPDPEKASKVKIIFESKEPDKTLVRVEHSGFENHGEGAEDYRKAMDSVYGWDYILNCYKQHK